MREIAPVVAGSGRPEDTTARGWGVVLDTIEIQDVRVLSDAVFANLQARYRNEQQQKAREAELSRERAVRQTEAEAELERIRLEAEAETARHAARLQRAEEEAARSLAEAEVARAKGKIAEAELAAFELELRRQRLAQELELGRTRTLREIENVISPEAVQLALAQRLPELAQAFQQKMGEVHVTAVDGANPFGYIAAAVEGVMGIARSVGLDLKRPPAPPAT